MRGILRPTLTLLLLSSLACWVASVAAEEHSKPGPALQQKLAGKYPGQRLLNSCDGAFLGRRGDAVVALYDAAEKRVTVAWAPRQGEIQQLDSLAEQGEAKDFELQCHSAKQVDELRQTLRSSETIENFLKVPAGAGAVCYFTDQTTAKCWALDAKSGKLIEAGGWQT